MKQKLLDLKTEIGNLKNQVNELSKKKPWYTQVPTLVAVAALFLSITTTLVSYIKNAHQDYLSSRVELRELISEISKIPHEHAEITISYTNKPEILSQLSAQLNTRNLVLSRQAVSVVERLENSRFGRGSVLGVEYIAIGTALSNSLIYGEAERYFDEGMLRTKDAATAAGSIRSRASISLIRNDIEEMRRLMLDASKIFEDPRFVNDPKISKDVTNSTTYVQWALGEVMLGNCKKSSELVVVAMPLASQLPDSPLKLQILSQVAYVQSLIQICDGYNRDRELLK